MLTFSSSGQALAESSKAIGLSATDSTVAIFTGFRSVHRRVDCFPYLYNDVIDIPTPIRNTWCLASPERSI